MKTLFLYAMLQLHGPGGQVIDINPDHITTLRQRHLGKLEEHLAKEVRCIIKMSDGSFNLVVEDCELIRKEIEGMHR
jgi:hypothetical protein